MPAKPQPSIQSILARLRIAKQDFRGVRDDYLASLETATRYYGDVLIAKKFRSGNAARYGWPPLNPGYAAKKARTHPGAPMLVATGAMRNSIVGHYVIKVDKFLVKVTLDFNSAVPYAAHLEDGAFKGSEGPRPWSEPSTDDRIEIERVISREMGKRLKKRLDLNPQMPPLR